MTESSLLWTNNGTGDGTSGGYTQAKLVEWMRALFTKSANRGGVSPDYLNELAVTGTSSPVAVASGAALAYGFVYLSDASVNVAVASPSVSTRIDRIVLRVNWSAQTVRITRVAGSEGSGSPPALTQSAGTTWDVPLAQVSITTGGVITVTDERVWLDVTGDGVVTAAKLAADAVTTAKILDANVTAAKLATSAVDTASIVNDAVDDTKVGDRVPQFYRRQGGDATDWSVYGTTNYTPTTVRMQAGVFRITSLMASGNESLTFPVAFSAIPIVLLTSRANIGGKRVELEALTTTATAFNIRWFTTDGAAQNQALSINWLAIGPE